MVPRAVPRPPVHADDTPCIVVSFPVQGRHLPADHGYGLYAAITQRVAALHSVGWLGLELLSGRPCAPGLIALATRSPNLRLRLPADKLAHALPLAGARLEIDGHPLRLGLPVARLA